MDDMQLEALRRAETMRGAYRPKQKPVPPKEEHAEPPLTETAPEPPKPPPDEQKTSEQTPKNILNSSPLDFLLNDRETSLILMMIFFLYEDNSDPMLIMALIYLLVD